MADEASIRVKVKGSEFEVSGSSDFVEKMIDRLYAMLPDSADDSTENDDERGGDDALNGRDERESAKRRFEDESAFAEYYKLERAPGQSRILAFVYYLTKIKRAPDCSTDDIRNCFTESGVDEPDQLTTVLSNLKKDGLLTSAGRGRYKTTGKGNRAVKGLAGSS